MSFIYNMADTWNAAGTTFNSILMNISDGAGGTPVFAAGSLAINIQSNGATIFSVGPTGNVTTNVTGSALNTYGFGGNLALRLTPGNSQLNSFMMEAFASSSFIILRRSQGTVTSPTATASGNSIGTIGGSGYGATGWATGLRASIVFSALETWTDTAQGATPLINTTPAGGVVSIVAGRFDGGSAYLGTPGGLATTATDGFLHIPTTTNTPTGVPTLRTGFIPMVFDTGNSQVWFYAGGSWKQPKTPAGAATITWQ